MNGNEYISAFADIPDDLVRSADDDAEIRKIFRRYRSRRKKAIGALCCCIVVAAAALGFGRWDRFRKTPAVIPGEPTSTEHPVQTQTRDQTTDPAPGVIPPETVSAAGPDARLQTTAEGRPDTPTEATESRAAAT